MLLREVSPDDVHEEIEEGQGAGSAWRAFTWLLVMVLIGASAIALLIVADVTGSEALEEVSFYPFYLMPSAFVLGLWHGLATARSGWGERIAQRLRSAACRGIDAICAAVVLALVVFLHVYR